MDITSCFCVGAAAVFFFTVLWKLKEGCGTWFWTVWALVWVLVGSSLYLSGPPVVCGLAVLGCSLFLMCETEKRVELQSRAVLITGFGLALALRLSESGLKVFAGVLDEDGAGAQQLRGCENLQVLQLDVTDNNQIETAHRYISTQVADTGLWGLVNNAGVLHCPVDAELQPITAFRCCMDVNFLSAVKMCQVFLPLLRRSRGRIVNVSSMAAEVPMPRLSAYGASKAALSVFSKVMRLELSEWGVNVALIQPAGFRTNIFGTSDDVARYRAQILSAVSCDAREDYGDAYISSLPRGLSRMSRESSEDVSPVVDAMCHALLSVRPKPVYEPGRMGRLLPLLHRCAPTAVFDAVIGVITKHGDRRPAGLSRSRGSWDKYRVQTDLPSET
ncbi:17-beta-hydroxysteroid dehydrogenase type 2 isoform X2 [Anarhichas minor]|uniref:17-beta-hydroxysteroid dehydrogenase type 2 isoform X2 n=1 Tax=Anarhichas minor TaxID=65739 RepID=UPI003F73EEA2